MEINEANLVTKLRAYVADLNGEDESEVDVSLDSDIRNDLDIDSLAVVELAVHLDDWFNVSIEDADVFEAVTVRDLLDRIQKASGV